MKNDKFSHFRTSNAGLLVPSKYVGLINAVDSLPTNGCGSSDPIGLLVPDTLFGTDISSACDIHDLMYMDGGTQSTRKLADDVFYQNMSRLINKSSTNGILNFFKKVKAKLFYIGVRLFGGKYFGRPKESESQLGPV